MRTNSTVATNSVCNLLNFAPVASHIMLGAFMQLIRCASIALAASLESSDENKFIVIIRERGT
jgi:hypothetical protein